MTEDIASPENPGPLLRVVKHQPIAFAIVGVANTTIGYVLFVVWSLILDNKDLYQVAVIGAYSISVLIAFVLHRTLVFRVRGHVARDLGAFIVVNSGGLVLNLILGTIAVSILHAPPLPAQAVVMLIVAAVSFFGHRYFSFRRKPAERH
ncbi:MULTISPECIES: GtrA family protein [Rhodococcus]|uniref:GtrA family protein n=1 Tax=Rhodococcus qingshengii JCM 15477 TaxID=1303681 RepID=A0AB38RK98_RHOSG|nr:MULTISPECIES: GtrA family protein [Rhodococcus]UPU45331.1 GtrA family protein [Rhodococcus qingshengii JCM 15477]